MAGAIGLQQRVIVSVADQVHANEPLRLCRVGAVTLPVVVRARLNGPGVLNRRPQRLQHRVAERVAGRIDEPLDVGGHGLARELAPVLRRAPGLPAHDDDLARALLSGGGAFAGGQALGGIGCHRRDRGRGSTATSP